ERLMMCRREGAKVKAMEMGLGKTIQAIAVSYYYKKEWPLLIVVPSSLRYPWVDEMEKWIPELCPDDISIIQNKTDIGRISTSKVTVLGYGLLTTDAQSLVDTLYKQNFKVVVVDESHYMKSRNATRSKILLPIVQNAVRAILLTGTPALGRPEELFMQLEALVPRKFGTWTEYAKKYCNACVRFFGKRAQWDCRGSSNLDELHKLLSNIMIRRLKKEVLTQLLPKIRQRIPFDLPNAAAKEFNTSFSEWEKLMRASNADSTESHFVQVMGLITRMFKQTAIAKAGAVKDYIKMMLENDKLKFLVFAHHLSMLQACTEAAIENKVRYIRIDGSVPSAERIHLVHQFQKDTETRVAILSIQAAGQGLTFTAATHVVFAELYWDPGHIKQAEDRAHRIGQSSSVNIHYLIANGTLDTLMWAMLNRKAMVTGSTLNGRKEKLQAEEGDKEKWDFLSFAEAWTPNESLDEIKNEILFTHLEKEKQHDIRTFLSPKTNHEKKRKMASCGTALNFSLESPKVTLKEDLKKSSQNLDSEKIIEVNAICNENACEREAKRPRALETSAQSSSAKKKRKPLAGKKDSFAEETTQEHSDTSLSNPREKPITGKAWCCSLCTYINNVLLPYCEMCESPQGNDVQPNGSQKDDPLSTQSEKENVRLGDSVTFPVYDVLMFCASRNTDRIHLFAKDGEPLNCNFIPLDVKLDNWEDLPESLQQTQNRSLILRFVREWSGLTAMKQKIIRKSGQIFSSPILAAEEILSKQQARLSSTKRYVTKEDVAVASVKKAQSSGGSVLHLEDGKVFPVLNSSSAQVDVDEDPSLYKGYLQAIDEKGNVLCLSCQQPTILPDLECKSTAWDTRFCSHKCQEDFLIRSSQSYLRTKVFEAERGVCQQCHLNAQELYLSVRDAPKSQRKDLLENSWMCQLPLGQLNEIILNPTGGHFWQVDHIKPVYSGGGQCSLENLQTLCTVCHKERTAKQAKERSQMKRLCSASKYGSDITKYFIKM
uniref:Zinc finger RANBP2-type containing 3 n=1 Tax=Sphenodon punctatus TaxID=8508 RepID=A0A8D0GHH9_SPHPU